MALSAMAAPTVEIARAPDCNLFNQGAPVRFTAALRAFPAGEGSAEVVLTDYFGEKKTIRVPVKTVDKQPGQVVLDFGVLEPNYYEIALKVKVGTAEASAPMMSFGVAPLISRTAEQVRNEGYRFGLKIFQIGKPGVWWRRGEVWDLDKVVTACEKLGLQWTRHSFNQGPSTEPGVISTVDLVTRHQMNCVMKVEGFPESCYDATRYGPIEDWTAKKKSWARCSVPVKEPYQKWLKEELAKLPPEQTIFEIGNEVWSYMSAEEFAEWCKMSREAIKEARPNAKVGADPGGGEFCRKFIAAGGMDGMDIMISHPYSFSPLPEHRIRLHLRNEREILRRRTGREYELWITEYGWSTAPQDKRKHSVSERVQAQRTTRQSLMLYAEDAKALIPHWMADREHDVTEREHFFGFFRLNQQPKPVVMAHAACARIIDGGTFVGDMWYEPGIGAMLFRKGDTHTLALWTLELDRQAKIPVGAEEVTLIDIMGREKKLATPGGVANIALSGDVVYLKGVGPGVVKAVIPAGSDLNPDLWSPRSLSVHVPKLGISPQIDGNLDEWATRPVVEIPPAKPGETPGKARGMMAWDDSYVYTAVEVTDVRKGRKLALEYRLGVRPDRQPDMGSTQIYDFIFKAPFGAADAVIPALKIENADFDAPLEVKAGEETSGVKWAAIRTETGFTAEVAVPVKLLRGMPKPVAGLRLCGGFAIRDSEDKNRALFSFGEDRPRLWPWMILEEAK
ncbi:hypothetical protein DB346_08355 [Verrucomicrobia bacterium LW23]|nr:hypothetical protein DB346_08355 [Verrucomicrobia bacterium LW23]